MSKSENIKPTVLIDLFRDVIRIHRSTLHIMGNPDYIVLIVNPDKRILGIIQSSGNERRAHKVRYDKLNKRKQSYELYSKALIENLKLLCPE